MIFDAKSDQSQGLLLKSELSKCISFSWRICVILLHIKTFRVFYLENILDYYSNLMSLYLHIDLEHVKTGT